MSINLDSGVYQIVLTQAEPEAEIELSDQNLKEFVIGTAANFDGGNVTIERFLSDNTGYTPYVIPSTGESISFNFSGSGFGLGFYHRNGKIKFVLNDAGASANVPIDIFK